MPQKEIKLDYRRFGQVDGPHVTEIADFSQAANKVVELHNLLIEGKSDQLKDSSVVMTGWKTESPFVSESELDIIQSTAEQLTKDIDDFVSIGIGGSYLGIQSTIDAVRGSLELFNLLPKQQRKGAPRFFFLGQNMDPAYTNRVMEILDSKKTGGVVISKSGGTVEPAIAFAIFKNLMDQAVSPETAAKRIVAVTDKAKGALKKLADQLGYKSFVVPDNVGGRFSVTCPVEIFALAVAGVNIKELIAGAKYAEEQVRN